MIDDAGQVQKLLRQQAALARFGGFALKQNDLHKILTEAARVCAEGLDVPFSKMCRYRAEENDLLIEAGVGWRNGIVGHVSSRANISSPQGRAFTTGEPSISNDLNKDSEFELPSFYAEHGIVSTIDVLIKGSSDRPYGVLEVDSDTQRDYDGHDVDFLTGFANVLAEAVDTAERTVVLQATIERMKDLVLEKDRLLDQRKVLAEELQHRVRNNLQLVYGMLGQQLNETADHAGQRGLRAIARRVSTLSQVYDQLLGTEMTSTIDFGAYVEALCINLGTIQAAGVGAVRLTTNCDKVDLDLDVVTALGIVVAELVTNSFDHAFPQGKGAIAVSVHLEPGSSARAVLTVSDDGCGFKPHARSKRHGLGLVRRLVEQVRGTIDVATDGGSEWTIHFPAPLTTKPSRAEAHAA
jgi:two-component sensor histidine kinase